ncbi:hypothetical protein [Massilia genomosp. 1]|uniref:Uncharacterized protein n=1 Tax=Massilia genomosp. 1 TaxID=2609280 RepID=A0ABX0MUS9_9BURK|nr:hypothetical protein [Massilia genomosp. 1]NHZ66480.1 hypothetical protein [Massilia genomosp. 1]
MTWPVSANRYLAVADLQTTIPCLADRLEKQLMLPSMPSASRAEACGNAFSLLKQPVVALAVGAFVMGQFVLFAGLAGLMPHLACAS